MSSEAVTTTATTSPFRIIQPQPRSYQQANFLAPPLLTRPLSTSSTSTSNLYTRPPLGGDVRTSKKRAREGTPIERDEVSGEGLDQNASTAAAYTTTGAEPDSFFAPQEDGSMQNQGTSDDENGEGSVLFSELVKGDQNGRQHHTSTSGPHGNMEDYLPQGNAPYGDEDEYEDGVDEDGGDEPAEQDEEDDEEGGVVLTEEQQEQALEELQDQIDAMEDEFEDEQAAEEAAKTPAWLAAPRSMTRTFLRPDPVASGSTTTMVQDRMSAVLESRQSQQLRSDPFASTENSDEMDEEEMSSSYHSGDTDIFEMDHRPILERTAVKRDICNFVNRFQHCGEPIDHLTRPSEDFPYQVVDRLGEGTFSSVYLAYDSFHGAYDNSYWDGPDDGASYEKQPRTEYSKVALKKILATSSPARIENELHILESLRGCRFVSQLITAFREEDQVIIVLPYHQSDDFRHFNKHMDTFHLREYMICLFRALKDIHRRGIIHRDVKPANFLFDYAKAEGVLCDFGLAERYQPPRKPTCQHAPATLGNLHGTRTKTGDTSLVEQAVYDARKRAKLGEGRIGFQHDDKRFQIKTNRAGTRGFRAPEVLLKCPDQTVAIDVWSAGIILLSILTLKFPVFTSSDDIEALLEIAAIFGRTQMERCAMLHNRTIITNVPSLDATIPTLQSIVLRLNPHVYTPPVANPTKAEAREHIEDIDNAIDLCGKLLRLDATRRLTASAALRHPFMRMDKRADGAEDLEYYEILEGTDGKCGHLHNLDTGKHRACFGSEAMEMQFGQGIPPSVYDLCPEHEQWQTRTWLNPLATCYTFAPDQGFVQTPAEVEGEEEGQEGEEDEEVSEADVDVVGAFALKERDVNVARRTVGANDDGMSFSKP